jgi:hypothetical protein
MVPRSSSTVGQSELACVTCFAGYRGPTRFDRALSSWGVPMESVAEWVALKMPKASL